MIIFSYHSTLWLCDKGGRVILCLSFLNWRLTVLVENRLSEDDKWRGPCCLMTFKLRSWEAEVLASFKIVIFSCYLNHFVCLFKCLMLLCMSYVYVVVLCFASICLLVTALIFAVVRPSQEHTYMFCRLFFTFETVCLNLLAQTIFLC